MRRQCKNCGGGSICEHQRQRSQCKDCGGSSICEHQRRKSNCVACAAQKLMVAAQKVLDTGMVVPSDIVHYEAHDDNLGARPII